jgi:S-adenosylmethionine/arginine decarboxylase-like enzyme
MLVPRDYVHILADFVGVPPAQLSDRALMSGLLIAAASAAGMNVNGIPTVRDRKSGGLSAVLVHDDCHITAQSVPERELLLVDVLAPKLVDGRRALDVFARRLTAREMHSHSHERG